MDWMSFLPIDDDEINITTPEKHPQYPHKEVTGDIGDTFVSITNQDYKKNIVDGMPKHFFNGGTNGSYYGDKAFIQKELRKYRTPLNEMIASRYSVIYLDTLSACTCTIKRENLARRKANQYLLKQRECRTRLIGDIGDGLPSV